jgi:hypothetical protein
MAQAVWRLAEQRGRQRLAQARQQEVVLSALHWMLQGHL